MKDALIAMLIALGVAKPTAEAEAAKLEVDPKATVDLPKIRGEITTGVKEILKNDATFVSEFETAAEGKIKATVERKLKQKFGLVADDVKDKKFDEIVDICYDKSTSSATGDVKTLQEDKIKLAAEIKELKEVTIPALEQKGDQKAKEYRIQSKLEGMVDTLDKEGKLRVKKNAALALANSIVPAGYDLDEDEAGNIVLFQKGKKLKAVNKDGTKVLELGDLLTDTFRENDFLKQSNADDKDKDKDDPSKKKVEVTTGNERKADNPHLRKAQENLEATKADIEANNKKD